MDITIRAENAWQAVLDGENSIRVIRIDGGTVALDGLNITKGNDVQGGGVYITGYGVVNFNNCDIHHNEAVAIVSARLVNLPQPFLHRPMEELSRN